MGEADFTPGKRPPPGLRLLSRKPLTARRAGVAIATATLVVTLAGAMLAWLLDRDDFDTLGQAVWWSVQTVTTVGYGDVTPANTLGRVIGALVMLAGIAFVTVVTAAITAAFIESARRRIGTPSNAPVVQALQELSERLERIERRLDGR
jgi:voltage-gated potassium channel